MAAVGLASILAAQPVAAAECKEEIMAMIDRSLMAGPYRTTAEVTANNRKITIVNESVPPDDMHTRTTADNATKEMIKVGDTVWLNDGQGWRTAPPAVAARIAEVTKSMRTMVPNLLNDAQCGGAQTVEGRTYTVYTYKMDVPGGKASSSNTLYVDPASRLPAKLVVDGRSGQMKSRSEMSYVYDASIKIEPPSVEAPKQ
jgi:hypothetical protein